MSEALRKEAKSLALRFAAAERVALRRWLRKYHAENDIELPDTLYLTLEAPELCDVVREFGGDPEELVESGRKRVIDEMMGEEE